MHKKLLVFALVLSPLLAACGKIPADAVGSSGSEGLTYTNETWGFRLTKPDSSWGISAQTYTQVREPNGLPQVEVVMRRIPSLSSPTFRPTLYVRPRALSEDVGIDSLASSADFDLRRLFRGYAGDQRQSVRRAGETSLEWLFRVPVSGGGNFLEGTRFVATVIVHGNVGFFLIGNGIPSDFPLDSYRQVMSEMAFLR